MATKTKPALLVAWQQVSELLVYRTLVHENYCAACDRDVSSRPHAKDCPFVVVREHVLRARSYDDAR
jgi:hypothetical protein